MADLLYHCQEDIEPGRLTRDGQFDAMLLADFYVKPETLYIVKHGLGRPVKQYQVVFADKPVKHPACARTAAGLYINDSAQIGLVFMEGLVTVTLRFC